jgi:tetrahydromethanopterin S-methyltransferase subunit G
MAVETHQTQAKRLDRIEEKIDKLADAMIALARAEEKLIAIEKNNHSNFERLNRFSQKLDDIEKKVDDNARTVHIINRIALIVGTGVIGGIIKLFWFM